MTMIGESALMRNSRQWGFGPEHEGCGAPNELDGSILAKRHAIRLAEVARQVNGMNAQELRHSGYGESLLRVVQQTTSTHGHHSIRVHARTNRGEQLWQRILILGDESQPGTKRRRYVGPDPLLDRFDKTIAIRNHGEDHG